MASLSLDQARKLALLSQELPLKSSQRSSVSKTHHIIEHLGYVQIDTISVVQRAHHHTLWNRNPSYRIEHLEQLVTDKQIFEYWSHAAAYLPMRDYRYTLPRKAAIETNQQNHWYKKDHPLMRDILKRIEEDGPLMAKDFVSENHKSNGWGSKPAKRALETLYMQGDLMIPARKNFHKIYDLTERVLPSDIDTTMPTDQEHGHFLVLSYLRAHGFGNLTEINYLLKGVKDRIKRSLDELSEDGIIEKVLINGAIYYTCSSALDLLNKRLNKKQAKLLSPFDNLIIQRKRASSIFNFDYLLECYVPAVKRQFGYFCLPILWDGRLIARADCKIDKQSNTLNVIHLFIERTLRYKEAFLEALEKELIAFALFNQCSHYTIVKITAR
ncbi:MAG: YcaQ family DNA glycosylase [Aliivibrio sp.]|uniref:winged helix-turn-helix domain-containing protein n=1 Tax=Aliivibrio sp. TaxID=1872443 RepID=UPI001A3BD5A4|nr:YcaQ family DNA glycosylase [Aliivibrio sp.]